VSCKCSLLFCMVRTNLATCIDVLVIDDDYIICKKAWGDRDRVTVSRVTDKSVLTVTNRLTETVTNRVTETKLLSLSREREKSMVVFTSLVRCKQIAYHNSFLLDTSTKQTEIIHHILLFSTRKNPQSPRTTVGYRHEKNPLWRFSQSEKIESTEPTRAAAMKHMAKTNNA